MRIRQLSLDDMRDFLKKKGWQRQDRTSMGQHVEFWVHKELTQKYPAGLSLKTAIIKQFKIDGFYVEDD